MQFSIIKGSHRETKIPLLKKSSRKLTKQTLVGGDQLSRFKFQQVTDPALTSIYVIEPQVLEVELDWFVIFVLEPVTLVNSRNHKQIRGVKLFISQNMATNDSTSFETGLAFLACLFLEPSKQF